MAQDNFQVPPEMRALAEQSMEQAKKAFDGFMTATHNTISTVESQTAAVQAGARDMTQKAVGFAEKNVAASFEFAQRLVRARDAQEVMALQAEYVKNQMQALNQQAQELGQTAASNAAKARPGG
jgi:phasin